MTDLSIRQATLADLDLLMAWRMEVLHCVFALPEDSDMTALWQANRDYYNRALADGTHTACLAYYNSEIIGCGGICLHNEMPSPDNPNGRCGYLMNIYVRPAYRGKGFANRIVRWLIGVALGQQTTKIYLETSEAGRPLYRSLGFREMKDMMIL